MNDPWKVSRWMRWGINGAVRDLYGLLVRDGYQSVICEFEHGPEDIVLIVARGERAGDFREFVASLSEKHGGTGTREVHS